jgi:hypothetical protein
MSQKISAKNLSYSRNLPPFLARLQGQNAYDREDAGPDPLLAGRRRHARPRTGSEEAEDAPVVVDEEGREFTEEVRVGADGKVKEGAAVGVQGKEDTNGAAGLEAKQADVEMEKVASIGASKKRKAGKVIGQDDGEDDSKTAATLGKVVDAAAKEARGTDAADTKKTTPTSGKEKEAVPPKKKAKKKIQLSFGDGDG